MKIALGFVALKLACLGVALGVACYDTTKGPPPCTNIMTCPDPTAPPPIWDRTEGHAQIGACIDVDSGVQDDAGVWQYHSTATSQPCPDGGTR